MKVEENYLAISAKEFTWQAIHLKHKKMQRSRRDKSVVVTVTSPRFVVSEYRER